MNNNIQCSIESSTTKIELNSAVEGVFLVPELEGLAGLPEIRTTSGVNAGYDGGWTSAQNYDARLISIRGIIANPDVAQVEAKRRAIASLLGQGRKEQLTLRFTTEAGNSYVIYVRTISCEMALQRVLTTQEFLIQLRADDPLIYDDGASSGTEAILQVQKALGGFEIDFELPLAIGGGAEDTIVENGSETVYPIINLYGPLHSPTVVNRTTNQQMQILADLQYTISWSGYQTKDIGAYDQLNNELDGAPMYLSQLTGNAEQNGTPTPDAPVSISTVTGEQVVKVEGKNLAEIPNSTFESFDVLWTAQNGTITIKGTTTRGSYAHAIETKPSIGGTANYPAYIVITEANSIQLPAGTYTISADVTNAGNIANNKTGLFVGAGQIGARPTTAIPYPYLTQGTSSASLTVAEGERVIISAFYEGTSTQKEIDTTISNIQLELGSTATAYEAYQGQEFPIDLGDIELAKIGTYQDRIYKSDGKWYIEKQIKKVILDGSEQYWAYVSGAHPRFTVNISSIKPAATAGTAGDVMSDYFTTTSASAIYSGTDNGIAVHNEQAQLWFSYFAITSLADFKTWLASNPTTVYYALATPTTTEITDETLLSQLNFIASLYGGVNNISLVGTGAQGEIVVKYATVKTINQDVAVIDSQARTITLNGQDIYHLKTEESEFLLLAPGDNKLYLTSEVSDDSGYAEVKFKQGYLSI